MIKLVVIINNDGDYYINEFEFESKGAAKVLEKHLMTILGDKLINSKLVYDAVDN